MSTNKNKKIPYPPKIDGYISSRLLKEELIDFLTIEESQKQEIDNLVRSTIKRFKLYAEENNIEKAILRKGERGKEQFNIELLSNWLKNRRTIFNKFNINNV